jgi:phage terminase large subunit-like protein
VLGKMPRAKKAMVQLRGGMQPFPEAFLSIITTQSDEAPAGVFKAEDLEKARAIRDGRRTGRMLPVLYEFPTEMQEDPARPWRDPENWPMVMPNLGRSIQLPTLIEECESEEEPTARRRCARGRRST